MSNTQLFWAILATYVTINGLFIGIIIKYIDSGTELLKVKMDAIDNKIDLKIDPIKDDIAAIKRDLKELREALKLNFPNV